MAYKVQFRRGTEANLPQLLEGEIYIATDTKKVFVGLASGNFYCLNYNDINTAIQTLQSIKSNVGHGHNISDISNLQSALDNKASVNHTHNISNINNLQTELDGKASVNHTHNISNINNLQTELDGKASVTHTHSIYDINSFHIELLPYNYLTETEMYNKKLFRAGGTYTNLNFADISIICYHNESSNIKNTTNNQIAIVSSANTYNYLKKYLKNNCNLFYYAPEYNISGIISNFVEHMLYLYLTADCGSAFLNKFVNQLYLAPYPIKPTTSNTIYVMPIPSPDPQLAYYVKL